MNDLSDIVFWQSMPSPHQLPVIKNLAEFGNRKVFWITENDVPSWRQEMGWKIEGFGKASFVPGPQIHELSDFLNTHGKNAVHIFSTDRHSKIVGQAFCMACRKNYLIGLMSESKDNAGVKGLARAILGCYQKIRLRNKIRFILSMGNLGKSWFESCGWPSEKIFEYAYVVDDDEAGVNDGMRQRVESHYGKTFKFIYVGQIVKRKGLDIAVQALSSLSGLSWELRVIGDGVQREKLMKKVKNLDLSERVSFLGNLSNRNVRQQIALSDSLILPSRFDG